MKDYFQTINEEGLVVSFTSEAKDLNSVIMINQLGISTVIFNDDDNQFVKQIREYNSNVHIGISCLKQEDHYDPSDFKVDFVILPCWDLTKANLYKENDIDVIPYCETQRDIERLYNEYDCFVINCNTGIEKVYKEKYFLFNTIDDADIKDSGYIDNILGYIIHDSMASLDNCKSTKRAIKCLLNVHLAHVGINASDDTQAEEIASQYSSLFYGDNEETLISFFGTNYVEVMKGCGRGTNGHVGIGVNNVMRALHYYQALGYQFDYNNARYDEFGNITLIYFVNELGNFAVHLVQE